MIFEVLTTQWGADEDVFEGGPHELTSEPCSCGETHGKPTSAFLALLGGAEAAGVVVVRDASAQHRAKLDRSVQSQEQGEAALVKAQGDWVPPEVRWEPDGTKTILRAGYWTGGWQHGNLVQAILDREDRLERTADEAEAASLEVELAGLRERLETTAVPE